MVQHGGGLSGEAGVRRRVGSKKAFAGCSENKKKLAGIDVKAISVILWKNILRVCNKMLLFCKA